MAKFFIGEINRVVIKFVFLCASLAGIAKFFKIAFKGFMGVTTFGAESFVFASIGQMANLKAIKAFFGPGEILSRPEEVITVNKASIFDFGG